MLSSIGATPEHSMFGNICGHSMIPSASLFSDGDFCLADDTRCDEQWNSLCDCGGVRPRGWHPGYCSWPTHDWDYHPLHPEAAAHILCWKLQHVLWTRNNIVDQKGTGMATRWSKYHPSSFLMGSISPRTTCLNSLTNLMWLPNTFWKIHMLYIILHLAIKSHLSLCSCLIKDILSVTSLS